MKAYEAIAKVTSKGKLELPDSVLQLLPSNQVVKVIVLVSETDTLEQVDWSRLTAEQFLTSYEQADIIYDSI